MSPKGKRHSEENKMVKKNGLTKSVKISEIVDIENIIEVKALKFLKENAFENGEEVFWSYRGIAIEIFGYTEEQLNKLHKDIEKTIWNKVNKLVKCLSKLEKEGKIIMYNRVQTTISPQRMNLYRIA
jgi:hypothetical protein